MDRIGLKELESRKRDKEAIKIRREHSKDKKDS